MSVGQLRGVEIYPAGNDTKYSPASFDVQLEMGRKWLDVSNDIQQWMNNPSLLANEEGIFPSIATTRLAWRVAQRIASYGGDPPLIVCSDGETGMSFEWRNGPISRWIEISDQGNIEEIVIRDGQVVSRDPFDLDD